MPTTTSSTGLGTQTGQNDVVKKPSHYQIAPGIEAMDVISAVLKELKLEGHEAYLMGNFLKYRLRIGDKDAVEQDLAKSNQYRGLLREARKPKIKIPDDFYDALRYQRRDYNGLLGGFGGFGV